MMKSRIIPNVYEDIRDFQLGILPPGTDNTVLKIGVASDGPLLEPISTTDPDEVATLMGTGPLVESAAYHLVTSGSPLVLVRANASIPGSINTAGAKTTLADGSTGTFAISGEPNDRYQIRVEVQRDGALGEAAFRYSMDGGDLFSAVLAVPASGEYEIPGSGLKLTFGGELKAGDAYSVDTVAPAMSLADVNEAIDAALADPAEWSLAHIIGAGTPALFAALAVKASEAVLDKHRFFRFVMEARDYEASDDAGIVPEDSPAKAQLKRHINWKKALTNDYLNSRNTRVMVAAGFAEVYSALTGRVMRRSVGTVAVARAAAVPVHIHLGDVSYGPLAGVNSIDHDEQASTGLDLAGFTTLRTLIGKDGFFITRGKIMAPEGSDFGSLENARVFDKACQVSRRAALDFLNRPVNVDSEGRLALGDAKSMEAYISAQLAAELISTGNVSDAFVVVKRAKNILATKEVEIKICIQPLGYLEHITLNIGFFNPALVGGQS